MTANASKNAKLRSLATLKNTQALLFRAASLSQEVSAVCPPAEASDPPPEASKMEVSLALTSKFDIFNEGDDKPDARALLLR